MPDLALDKCSLLAVFVESVLWGLLFAIYLIAAFLLLQKKLHVAQHVPHLVLAAAMLVLCTTHVGLSFARLIDAFFRAPSPPAYLADMTALTYRLKHALLFIQLFLGHLLIVSRCFTHWRQNYAAALPPALLALGALLAAAGASHAMSAAAPAAPVFAGPVRAWVLAALALALAAQALCLALVAARARTIHTAITAHVDRHAVVYTLMVVLVDSGALACATSAALLGAFLARQNAQYIVSDALSPIMAITVMTILGGMTVKLANPGPALVAPRPAWSHHTARSPTTPARAARVQWHDFEEDPEIPTTSSSGHGRSRGTSMHDENKSTGTLNLSIVI